MQGREDERGGEGFKRVRDNRNIRERTNSDPDPNPSPKTSKGQKEHTRKDQDESRMISYS